MRMVHGSPIGRRCCSACGSVRYRSSAIPTKPAIARLPVDEVGGEHRGGEGAQLVGLERDPPPGRGRVGAAGDPERRQHDRDVDQERRPARAGRSAAAGEAKSTITSSTPAAPDASGGQRGMSGTSRAIRMSSGIPTALRPQAHSAPRQALRRADVHPPTARGIIAAACSAALGILQQRRQRDERDRLADHLRVAQAARLHDQRVGSGVAGQEHDASVVAVLAQPPVGVDAARHLRPEVDVQNRDATMERPLAERDQIAGGCRCHGIRARRSSARDR